MKLNTLKIAFALIAISLFFSTAIIAQKFRFDDPNIIFKDGKGNAITADSANALISNGPTNIQTSTADDGKVVITITRSSVGEKSKTVAAEKNRIVNKTNTPFPEFNLTDLAGKTISKSDFKEKHVVLNFWFIGCKPCIAEIPELNRLVDKYKNENILFLAPSIDKMSSLISFAQKNKFDYKILAEAGSLAAELGFQFYPTSMIVDKNGIIKEILVGGSDDIYSKLDALIQKTISNGK